MNRIRPILIAAFMICMAPLVALAHEGPHDRLGLTEGLRHLLSQSDHLLELAVLAALLFAGWRVYRSRAAR